MPNSPCRAASATRASPSIVRLATGLAAILALGTASCQALPPPVRAEAREGLVRADSPEEARAVARALDELYPAVLAELPDVRPRRLEVWVQDEPALYRFPSSSAYRDADGFYSEQLGRIHLRADADDVRRTLVHELVHASLGPSWRALPGSIEEGLCDVVAARHCPESAPRLRAGRLLAAARALGGLEGIAPPDAAGGGDRVLDPMDVFRSHAGLSSSGMRGDRKKALYGLAYLVAQRIVDRRGIAGFHRLVRSESFRRPAGGDAEALLAAAGLTSDPDDWRAAICEALGTPELAELARNPFRAPAGPHTGSDRSGAAGDAGSETSARLDPEPEVPRDAP